MMQCIQGGTTKLNAATNSIRIHFACLYFGQDIFRAFKKGLLHILASFSACLQEHQF